MKRMRPGRAAREARKVVSAATPTHLHLRERLQLIAAATLAADLVGTVLTFLFERHARRSEITNLGDALFWTSGQLLTVSSNLPNPLTTGGRVVDILLEIYAITVVGAVAGSFGAFFHRRGMERHPIGPPDAGGGP
jgi:hypothetical protein